MASSSNTRESSLSIVVVICTHNRPAALERCLQRLQQVDDCDFSVVVVDSAPNSSDAKAVARRYGASYRISPLEGVSRARNLGARVSDSAIIAYLDDDMMPHKHWLGSLTAEFTDKDVKAATGPVLAQDLADRNDVDLQLAVELVPWGPHRFQIDKSSNQWFERTNFGGIGDGNLALRRSAFDQIQGFDERIGRGAIIDNSEEHYAYFRLVERGGKIAYTPRAIVFHPNLPASGDVLRRRIGSTIAFAAFLAWNHPARSWRVAKFLIESIFGGRRWWKTSLKVDEVSISTRERIESGMNGLSMFFRSLRKSGRSADSS